VSFEIYIYEVAGLESVTFHGIVQLIISRGTARELCVKSAPDAYLLRGVFKLPISVTGSYKYDLI
jgi:hypothetical protein